MIDTKKIELDTLELKKNIITLLDNTDSMNVLAELVTYVDGMNILSAFGNKMDEIMPKSMEFDDKIKHYDKIVEMVQRFYFTENIVVGSKEIDVDKLAKLVDDYIYNLLIIGTLNEMNVEKQDNQANMSNAYLLTSYRTLITGNITPILFYEHCKDIAEFFFRR